MKRFKVAFWVSLVLPVMALAILMLRSFGEHSRLVAFTLYGIGWVLFIVALLSSQTLRSKLSTHAPSARALWQLWQRPVLTALALVAIAIVGLVLLPPGHAEIDDLPVEKLTLRIDQDLSAVEQTSVQLHKILERSVLLLTGGNLDTPESKAALAGAWAGYVDCAVALDQFIDAYKFFYRINPLEHEGLNSRSFLIAYTALAAQTDAGLSLIAAVGNDRNLETWLDEPHPELGLQGRSYFQFRQGLTRADTLLRLNAGFAYLQMLNTAWRLQGEREQRLVTLAQKNYKNALQQVGQKPQVVTDNPLDYFEATAFSGWFPLQKAVAIGMSEIRTTGRENFVSPADIALAHQKLEPGDILLERRNWYLTNVGLPGFWPHAAYFTGTLEEMDHYFDEEARTASNGLAPSEYLQRNLPKVFAAFHSGCGHDPCRITEAVGEGVILSSLQHSAHADYFAALRPRQSKADKLGSILRAFTHYGKPYDYDFDFVTDSAIVCSELVYKSVQPVGEHRGVHFDLVTTSGRLVLPPNDIVRKFDEEYGKPEAELDFVLFFDGNEAERKAIERGAEELRHSWQRPKWDVAQP